MTRTATAAAGGTAGFRGGDSLGSCSRGRQVGRDGDAARK